MAGAFGGDDEEQNIEQPEEETEEVEQEEDDEEDDEDDEIGIQKKIKEMQEKRLKPKMTKLIQKLQGKQTPFLNPLDKRTFEQAKQHKNLKLQVKQVEMLLAAKRVSLFSKIASIIAPILPWLLIGGLILLALMLIVYLIAQLMPWLFPGDPNVGGSPSAQFGIKGDKFYGARAIYSDDELARVGLLEHYTSLIEDAVDSILTYTETRDVDTDGDGTNEAYTITITVNISLPQGEADEEGKPTEYDYSNFNESTFKSAYGDVYTLINEIAGIVFEADNPDYTGNDPTNLVEKLDLIKYFGFNRDSRDAIQTLITDYILGKDGATGKYTIIAKNSESEEVEISSVITDLESYKTDTIETFITTEVGKTLEDNTIQAEKLFIKDFIFETAEDMMEGIEKLDYIAVMFMAKEQVTYTKLSFSISYAEDDFSLICKNGEQEITLKKDDANYTINEDDPNSFIYINDSVNTTTGAFTLIDTNNLKALAKGVSLIEIIEELDENIYLTAEENNGTTIYTYAEGGLITEFTSEVTFVFVEWETLYE